MTGRGYPKKGAKKRGCIKSQVISHPELDSGSHTLDY